MRFTSRVIVAISLIAGSAGTAAFGQVGGGAVTGTSIGVSTVATGTVLQVNPAVSADRRYVGMAIHPQFSTLEGVDTFVLDGLLGTAGGSGGVPRAVAIRPVPFRPAVVGNTTFVDRDKTLLAAVVKPAEMRATSLKAAVRKLADTTRMNIVFGDRGFEQTGADIHAPHDFVLKPADPKNPLTMKDALLSLISTALPETDVVITAEDKVITIASQAQADQVLVTRTYYLADLLAAVPRFVAGGTDLGKVGPAKTPAAQQPLDETSLRAAPPKPATPGSTNILDVVTSTVRPEIWKVNGGRSEIYLVRDRVTVKAPASVHALLEGPKVHNPNKVNSYVTYPQ